MGPCRPAPGSWLLFGGLGGRPRQSEPDPAPASGCWEKGRRSGASPGWVVGPRPLLWQRHLSRGERLVRFGAACGGERPRRGVAGAAGAPSAERVQAFSGAAEPSAAVQPALARAASLCRPWTGWGGRRKEAACLLRRARAEGRGGRDPRAHAFGARFPGCLRRSRPCPPSRESSSVGPPDPEHPLLSSPRTPGKTGLVARRPFGKQTSSSEMTLMRPCLCAFFIVVCLFSFQGASWLQARKF